MARTRRGTGCIFARGRIWWIKYYAKGEPLYESSGSDDKRVADSLLRKRIGEIAAGGFAGLGPERILIEELFRDVLDDYRLHRRASTDDVEARIRLHLNPVFGKTRAAELSTAQVSRYIASRRNEGAEDATINRELSALRRALNLGAQSEPRKVVRTIKITRLKTENVRVGFLEHGDYLALRAQLPDYARLLLVIGYYTGIRSGELRKIKWEQVDFNARQIRLNGDQTKNRKPRTVPIYSEMEEWLRMAKDVRDATWPTCPWVFARRGQRLGDIRKVWFNRLERVGLPRMLFHDLRRSAVRNMERAGFPRRVAMEISGHRTESVYQRYDIVSSRDMETARQKMEQYRADEAAAAEAEVTKKLRSKSPERTN